MKKAPKAARPKPPPPARLERTRALGLATVAGLLWVFATAPFDVSLLAWIAPAPLLFVVDRATTNRRAFLYAWWAGVVCSIGGFHWVVNLLARFGGMPYVVGLLGVVLLAAYQGLVFGGFALAVRGMRRAGPGLPMALVAPLAIATFEYLIPMIFPYTLAITQAWQPVVIQIADLTGVYGVTAVLFCVGGAIYDLAVRKDRRRAVLAAAPAALALTLIYGAVRMGQIDGRRNAAPKLKVGLVQPNVAMRERTFRPRPESQQLADLQRLSAELEARGAELIVWPEASFPYWIERRVARDWRPEDVHGPLADTDVPMMPIRYHARKQAGTGELSLTRVFSRPVVVGAITQVEDGPPPFNSMILVAPDGTFTGRFDKTRLVMFSEQIPLRDRIPAIQELLPAASGHFSAGDGAKVLPLVTDDGRTVRLGPMICYEDIIPSFGREVAALRPHLLVNITNDAWFGADAEPYQHLALSVFRAVEIRTDLVRAVNTGVSAFVDANGRVVERGYALDQARQPDKDPRGTSFLREVALLEGGHTVYAAVGDLFAWLCAAATFFLWLVVPRLRARRSAADKKSPGLRS